MEKITLGHRCCARHSETDTPTNWRAQPLIHARSLSNTQTIDVLVGKSKKHLSTQMKFTKTFVFLGIVCMHAHKQNTE